LITKDDVKDAIELHMVHLHGFDKRGHPAIIIHAQRHDAANRDVDTMVRFIVYIAQNAVQVYVSLESPYCTVVAFCCQVMLLTEFHRYVQNDTTSGKVCHHL
jgi:hypothetical protein